MNLFIRPVLQVDEPPHSQHPELCEVELKVWTCIFLCTNARQLHPSILRLCVTALNLPIGQALAVAIPTTCVTVMPEKFEHLKLKLLVCLHGDFPC